MSIIYNDAFFVKIVKSRDYFHQKAPLTMFERVLNMPLQLSLFHVVQLTK